MVLFGGTEVFLGPGFGTGLENLDYFWFRLYHG